MLVVKAGTSFKESLKLVVRPMKGKVYVPMIFESYFMRYFMSDLKMCLNQVIYTLKEKL